jgi:hypothetical protein
MGLTSVPLLRDVTPASDSASIPEVLDEVLSRDVDQGLFVDVHGVEFVFRTRDRAPRAPLEVTGGADGVRRELDFQRAPHACRELGNEAQEKMVSRLDRARELAGGD